MVFGNIRHFITENYLEQYSRIYQYGHFSLFRNTEKWNRFFMDANELSIKNILLIIDKYSLHHLYSFLMSLILIAEMVRQICGVSCILKRSVWKHQWMIYDGLLSIILHLNLVTIL